MVEQNYLTSLWTNIFCDELLDQFENYNSHIDYYPS
jgi:hypothetical protein